MEITVIYRGCMTLLLSQLAIFVSIFLLPSLIKKNII